MTTTTLMEFPCKYPFKIIGNNTPELFIEVINILKTSQVKYYEQSATIKPSSKNNYQSITIEVDIKDKAHLEAIHKALKACKYIKMML